MKQMAIHQVGQDNLFAVSVWASCHGKETVLVTDHLYLKVNKGHVLVILTEFMISPTYCGPCHLVDVFGN